MTGLPRQLRPWAPHLALLQRDLAISLAPWIQRLAAAIGALAGTADPHTGDPDGYDGVIRRGPYERLLPTEWLFAEAAPEEFDRRAAAGEHQFYRLATREPNATRRCLVLFDAGPSQLGTPRIAHLAALIVFAARCEAAKADLFWGTLQGGPARIQEGFTKARAETLLAGRSALEGTPEMLHAWLTAPQLTSDDVWLVGAPHSPAAPKVNRLEVTDVLELDARRVDITLRRPARAPLRLQLDLPPPADCTRLLRAPFAEAVKPRPSTAPPALQPQGDLVFGIVANRVHLLGRDGELIVLPVPQGEAPWRTRAIIHRPAKGDRIVAVGWKTGAQAVVARHDAQGVLTQFAVCALTRRGELKRAPELYKVDGPMPAVLGGLRCAAFQFDRVLLAFADGLVTLIGDRAKFSPMDISAHAATGNGIAVLSVDAEGRNVLSLASVGDRAPTPLEAAHPLHAFFGRGHRGFSGPSVPMLVHASRHHPQRWTLESFSQRSELLIPADTRVVGASGRYAGPGLVLLGGQARTLSLLTAKGHTPIGQSTEPIVSVATDFSSDCIAWLDAKGVLGVANLGASGRFLKGEHVKGSARFLFTLGTPEAPP